MSIWQAFHDDWLVWVIDPVTGEVFEYMTELWPEHEEKTRPRILCTCGMCPPTASAEKLSYNWGHVLERARKMAGDGAARKSHQVKGLLLINAVEGIWSRNEFFQVLKLHNEGPAA